MACAEAEQGRLDEGTLVAGGTDSEAGSTGVGGSVGGASGGASGAGGMLPMAGSTSAGGAGGGGGATSLGGSSGAGGGGAGGVAGTGGAGGSAGNAGSAGAGGMPPATGHRYAKLVAKTELGGKVWSSVAELQLYTTGEATLVRSSWKVTADSQELDDEPSPATAAIDGNTATFWHSAWEPEGAGDAVLPHELVVDLGSAQTITGFSYLPRQDQGNGRIGAWEFYLSKDGASWGTAVKTGTFPAGAEQQKISF